MRLSSTANEGKKLNASGAAIRHANPFLGVTLFTMEQQLRRLPKTHGWHEADLLPMQHPEELGVHMLGSSRSLATS